MSPRAIPPAPRREGPEGCPRGDGERWSKRLEGGHDRRDPSAVPQESRRGPAGPSDRQDAAGGPAWDGCRNPSTPRPTRGRAAKARLRRLDDGGLRVVCRSGFPRETAWGIRRSANDRGSPVRRMFPRCTGRRPPQTPPTLLTSRCVRPESSSRWSACHTVPSGASSRVARKPRMAFLRDHAAPSRLLAIRPRIHAFTSDSRQPTVRRLSRIGCGKSPLATSARIDLRDRPVRASTSGIRRMRGDASGFSALPRDISFLPLLPGATFAPGHA